MGRKIFCFCCCMGFAGSLAAQTAVDTPPSERKAEAEHAVKKAQEKRAQKATEIEFHGQQAFTDKQLRSQLKEQISALDQYGLSAAQGDDLAFFLELIYRKHGYAKVSVHYTIEGGTRLRLEINEGPLFTLGLVTFDGNVKEPTDKLFDYVVGPTRERYSRLQRTIPFVAADLREGAELVHRFYVAEGFLDAVADPPRYTYRDNNKVDVTVPIHENRQYFFGTVTFTGQNVYEAETLRGQIADLLKRPYTDARVDDIRRRLQTYFKTRGYYDVKVVATGLPEQTKSGSVPVQITVASGPVYRFGEVTVSGLIRLRSSFVTKRFSGLSGKTYSPDVLDERFRTLMKTGLFSLLTIKPEPVGNDVLRLNITAEEAKSKQLGFSLGYGTYPGGIVGAQYRDGNFLGYGRPVTTSVELSQRGYKGEIAYEDPFFFDTDLDFKVRLGALTFDFDGYSKFEIGGQFEIIKKITKQDEAGVTFAVRHVDVTGASIKPRSLLGQTSYFVNTLGFANTFDLRDSPLVTPRGLLVNNTIDLAVAEFGSDIEFIRSTMRVGYYIPFAPKSLDPGSIGVETGGGPPLQRWFRQSLLAFGARAGTIHSLTSSGSNETTEIPIDERFFNGGNTTVRSFSERDLGPHDRKGNPIGGEFFTVFNVEYTFPIFGELQGAFFADAGNLLPSSEEPGLNDMRYGVGAGLRYKLPIGPIRVDYGINPDRRPTEDFGAFHFSFGFAF
ncbi:MAG: BamA/TamA family outer membrane protein [Verrucomicrobiota bacterium]